MRYELRPSTTTKYVWVCWDTKDNRVVYGAQDEAQVRNIVDMLNVDPPLIPVTKQENYNG